MALFSGITSTQKLGGIFGLSCYLLLHAKIPELTKEGANKDTPIFMGHGDSDPLVRPGWGMQTAEELKKGGWKVDLKMYSGMEHSACPEEIDDVEKYLNERIPPLGDASL